MAAFHEKDGEHYAQAAHSARCTALNAKGNPCGAWALAGRDVCQWHSLTPEERLGMARRGGQARATRRRETTTIASEPTMPGPTLARVLEVCSALLDARLRDTGERNYESAAFGALVLAQVFRVKDRERVLELLSVVRPRLARDPQVHRLVDLEASRAQLLEAYKAGRITADELPAGVLA